MLSLILFACVLFSTALALPPPKAQSNCDKFPNGTDTKPVWFMCEDVKNEGTIYSIKFQDVKTGKDEYPIKLTKPLNVVMDINSPSDYSTITLDIDIYSWGGFSGCDWHKVPTFGLLNGLDACKNGVPCPIKKGRHTITINLDFTKYSRVVGLLANDSPYKLHYKLTDSKTKKATCAAVEARALTK